MTAEIIDFASGVKTDAAPVDIVRQAGEAQLKSMVVLGETQDGQFYFASSIMDAAEILWLMENARAFLLDPERG